MTKSENGASQKALLLLEWWKPVKGYEGLYEVSNVGNVCRVKQSNVSRSGYHLKQFAHWDRRLFVRLSDSGKAKTKKIHKLMVDAFLGGTPDEMTVHHKDDCCTNNRLSNFAFLTARDNWFDAYQKGLTPRGERGGRAKITEAQAKEILSLRGKMTLDLISKKYGITGTAASFIWQGKNWGHLQTASEKASYHKVVRRGNEISSAILNSEKVKAIRSLKGQANPKDLAKEYGVSRWTIYKLWSGKGWTHVE